MGACSTAGLKDGDLLELMQSAPAQQLAGINTGNPFAQGPDGTAVNAEAFLRALRANSQMMATLPEPARRIVEAGDTRALNDMLRRTTMARHEQEGAAMDEPMPDGDPLSPTYQACGFQPAKLAEHIRQKNVAENMQLAWDHSPEVFGRVIMLYVDMEVNGTKMKAFVDSGAQMTIMSQQAAERCNILRLMDTRWAGMARGVGTGKILGRVHQAPLRVGSDFITASISVMETQSMEFLFGLDMLRRHACTIDLKRNVLTFGSLSSELPFLAEHEIPGHLREEEVVPEDGQSGDAGTSRNPGSGSSGGAQQQQSGVTGQTTNPGGISGTLNTPSLQSPGSAAAAAAAAAERRAAGQQQQHPEGAPLPAGAAGSGLSEKVQALVALGFSEQQSIEALQACGGNADAAASFLSGF
eukprot:jgi/Astpho2/9093/Aster-x1562